MAVACGATAPPPRPPACAGTIEAMRRARCPAPILVRAELRHVPASPACERAIDVFARDLGDGPVADLGGIARSCPPGDRAAAEALVDRREDEALGRGGAG